jgi:hypothetical protein
MLPSYQGIRLSRLTHPRASLLAIVLLAVVFGLFGVVASAAHPELSHAVQPGNFLLLARDQPQRSGQ